ncbi:hypothetical protein B0H12DRAFT_52472, partial [Mycena haematopus]
CRANYTERETARAAQLQQLAGVYNAEGITEYPQHTPDEPNYMPPMFMEPEFPEDASMYSPPANISQLMEELGQTSRPQILTPEESRELVRQEYQRLLEEAYLENHDDEEDRFVGDDLPIENLQEDDDEDDCFDFSHLNNSEYYP